MERDLVDKFPLECIGVRVEIPELYETKLAKLGDTAVSRLGLEWCEGWNGEGDYDDCDNKTIVMLTPTNLKEELAESHLLASEERSPCRRDWGGVALGGHHHHNDDHTW